MKIKYTLILPSYNEFENLKILIPEIFKCFNHNNYQIIVVDDNSEDNSTKNLKKIFKAQKKITYILRKKKRDLGLSINEGIKSEKNKTKKNMKDAAAAKKARFNVLRIYRRYKNPKECKILTKDMKYMDKKYDLGTTKNICKKTKKKKGGA